VSEKQQYHHERNHQGLGNQLILLLDERRWPHGVVCTGRWLVEGLSPAICVESGQQSSHAADRSRSSSVEHPCAGLAPKPPKPGPTSRRPRSRITNGAGAGRSWRFTPGHVGASSPPVHTDRMNGHCGGAVGPTDGVRGSSEMREYERTRLQINPPAARTRREMPPLHRPRPS
jgi:hypothetical protein